MSSIVLVLIATPGGLHAPVVGETCEEIRALGGTSVSPIPLAPVEACEFDLEGLGLGAIRTLRETIAARHPTLDVCTIPALHRRKRLLIADMDSTIIQQECIDEMADMLGLKPQIAAITERAMRGELKFEDALRERLGLLAGITEGQLEDVFQTRLSLMPGARTLVSTMKANGATTALVSGGFTFFTSRIAARVGFNENQANTLDIVDGKLTGQVIEPILGKEAKLSALEHYANGLEIDLAETLAVGDGANDLDMIRAAGLGVAYRAKPIVAAEADAAVTHGDLTALLYLQGYSKEEFVID